MFFWLTLLLQREDCLSREDPPQKISPTNMHWLLVSFAALLIAPVFLCDATQRVLTTNDIDVYVPWYFNSGSEQVWYGDTLWFENYVGKQNYEYNVSFSYDTQYRICSNSKLFTAVSILQLVEKGVIDSVYDDINLYLNETDMVAWGFPAGTKKYCPTVYGQTKNICQNNQNMTFASLMSMSSGIIASITCAYTSSQWQYQYCVQFEKTIVYYGSIAKSIGTFIQNPLWTIPRTTYNIVDQSNLYAAGNTNSYFYANENFIILSYLVQKLSGLSLRDYYQQNIFTPMQLRDTFFDAYSQEFLIKNRLASEYFFYTDFPFPMTTNPSASSGAYPPFAMGSCAEVEVNPGFQGGSGGIISTLPDMVKWYTSLFVKRNTTVLTNASVDLLLYPWAISDAFPFYYGFATEMVYSPAYWSSPNHATFTTQNLTSLYYMGGSMCTFFTIEVWIGQYNPFTGQKLITLPVVTAVARNNRILNVTQSAWKAAQSTKVGTWPSITQYGDYFYQALGWSDTGCCGDMSGVLTDTEYTALNLALYFASIPFGGAPTGAPVPVPASMINDDDDIAPMTVKAGYGAVISLVLGLLIAAVLLFFGGYWIGKNTDDHGAWLKQSSKSKANVFEVENPIAL
jgi:CubicO group peptidase (beta-lactamase class C family)